MVLYATDHERQLIVAALSFYAQHLGNIASPVIRGRAAVAGVIVHRACADLVQLDGVRPRPIVVGVSQQADFAFSLEKFIGFRCKFCSKFNGHKFNLA